MVRTYYGARYYEFNAQGDVVALYDGYGALLGTYAYDSWGKLLSVTDPDGNAITSHANPVVANPIRYRGYYYDTETGFYYLNSRYYDPETRRFVNADSYISTGQDITGFNRYCYCGNNPVVRSDNGGEFWDVVFDVASLVVSTVDVICNPTDPMAWVGLAADVVSLAVPGLTGGGAIVKAITKADDVIDAVKVVDKVDDATDVLEVASKVATGTDAAKVVSNTTKKVTSTSRKVTTSTSSRTTAVRKAWKIEYEDIKNGGNGVSRLWNVSEKTELLRTGKVRGYQGHHMKSVNGYPHLAGDPNNIQFLTRAEHLQAHGGNWRNITHGRYYY